MDPGLPEERRLQRDMLRTWWPRRPREDVSLGAEAGEGAQSTEPTGAPELGGGAMGAGRGGNVGLRKPRMLVPFKFASRKGVSSPSQKGREEVEGTAPEGQVAMWVGGCELLSSAREAPGNLLAPFFQR